jgi:TetR/AcrR family transcriptional regulator, tetracycline repressor protein
MAIEREKILDAAMVLLNEVGLERLTTRKLAERLGVQQPALYWHFRSKSALLDALNDLILMRYHHHRVPGPGETWEEFAVATARSFRSAMLAVRDGARINAGTRPSAPQFADAELQLRLFVDAGFSAEEAFHISIALARYVVGFVLEEQDERERDETDGRGSDADPMAAIADFPLLSEALRPIVSAGTVNTEAAFEAGLGYLVSGAREALAGKRRQ